MKKENLVKQLSDSTGIEAVACETMVNATMQIIKDELQSGGHLELRGFGTFYVKEQAPKVARNISKGTMIQLPARKKAAFRPSKKGFVIS